MKLHVESVVEFSRPVVYRAYRDNLADLVPFLPNVRGIDVVARKDEGPVAHLTNEWHGGGDVPAAVRSVLSEKMMSWTDYAVWDEREWSVSWRMETGAFPGVLDAHGKNTFHEHGEHTLLVVDGELAIDGRKLPVPRLLASTIGAAAEKFLLAAVRPNIVETGRGLQRYLASLKK